MRIKLYFRTRYLILLAILSIVSGFASSDIFADTVSTRDGKEIRGIVVEDYKDRIKFSTADGEIMLMKSDIRELDFDSEEDNLVKLANQAQEHRDYDTAFAYYEKAQKLNPVSKQVRDGLVFVQSYLYRKDELKKQDAVNKLAALENNGGAGGLAFNNEEEELKEAAEKLKDSRGLTLKLKGNAIQIASVLPDSPAFESDIKKGDLLVAIWGKLVGYMTLKDILDILVKKSPLETRCTIERIVEAPINKNRNLLSGTNDLIGCDFSMEFDGLTVTRVKDDGPASSSGIMKDDLVVAIDGQSTRYMPLKNAIEIIKNSKEDNVKLTIRREVALWGKGG